MPRPVARSGAPYDGSVVTNNVEVYVDANGITDPEAVAQLAGERVMQTLVLISEGVR